MKFGSQSMVAPLRRVILKRPEEAFRDHQNLNRQWKDLNYRGMPDLSRAIEEHKQLASLLEKSGAEVLYMPADDRAGLDSIYTYDPAIVTEAGAIVFQTGKKGRQGEGPAMADAFRNWQVPLLGEVKGEATAEGGDLLWLDRHTLLAGRGFRTNDAGIQALRSLLTPNKIRVIAFDLPYWSGPGNVLHLMSFISLLDDDLAIVHRKLMPVALFQLLSERNIRLIDVPEDEYDSLGCNALALAPRHVAIISGNPKTRVLLEAACCRVEEFSGKEIGWKGTGGPTCLTRPLLRE